MTIRDSSFTNPDALRRVYLNPRNVLRALEEDQDAGNVQLVNSVVSLPPGGGPIGGGGINGNGGGDLDPANCPAATEYVEKYISSKTRKSTHVLTAALRPRVDYLYHPILKSFHKLAAIEIVEDTECVQITSKNGVSQIVSLTHPVIQKFKDEDGTPAETLRDRLLTGRTYGLGAVSCIDLKTRETRIGQITTAGRLTVVHIHLEDGHIFASGTIPGRYLLGHNNRKGPGSGSGGFDPNGGGQF